MEVDFPSFLFFSFFSFFFPLLSTLQRLVGLDGFYIHDGAGGWGGSEDKGPRRLKGFLARLGQSGNDIGVIFVSGWG